MPFWQAPPECPQEPAFTAEVERFLGQKLDSTRQQSLEISADVTTSYGRGYVARLRVVTPRGSQERELSHRDCAELTEAAALVTALAIDPELVIPETEERAAPTESAPDPQAEPARPTPDAPPVSLLSEGAPGSIDHAPAQALPPWRFAAAAAGLFGNAVLPDVGLGLGARVQVARRRFALRAQADYWFPRFIGVGEGGGSGPGVTLSAWGVGVLGCGLPLLGELGLAICLGPVVGDLYGAGNSLLAEPRSSHRRWSALVVEADFSVASSSLLAGWFGLQLGKTLEVPHFGISEDSRPVELFAANAWTIGGLVGVGLSR